ncbi:MAG: nickel pincer cofactor biosynthesis protein LarC [Desulfonatronovibrio sp.]
MKKLYLDLSRGISGDMFISALADTGIDFGGLEQVIRKAGIQVRIDVNPEKRNGISGRLARISWEEEQPLRNLEQIAAFIRGMNISEEIRNKSIQAFYRLAQVEAGVHGVSVERVHFHETGAVDTLVDIVGVFWALQALGVSGVTASPLPWFGGEVRISHGLVSLPAPATAALMQGKKISPSNFDWEVVTPTGALLVDQLVTEFENGFQGKLLAEGLGFGAVNKEFNGLRVFLWEDEAADDFLRDQVWLLESNIDHLTGEEIGCFFEKIMQAGALDVIFLQGIMKKNRPGGQLQVLCADENFVRVRSEFFSQTLTLGMRISRVSRNILPRKNSRVSFQGESVRAKETFFSGGSYLRPEMESLSRLAEKKGMSPAGMRMKKNQP